MRFLTFNGGGLNFVFLVMLVAPVVTNEHAHLALAREQVIAKLFEPRFFGLNT